MRSRSAVAVLLGAIILAAAPRVPQAGAAGLEPVARSAALELLFDEATGQIAVRELASGDVWRSAPEPAAGSRALAPAQARMVASPFALSYLNRAGTVSLAADSFTPGVAGAVSRTGAGVRVAYTVTSADPAGTIRFAVEYALDGDALLVRVPGASVAEDGDLMIVSLQVLPFFGANADRSGGGLVLPDGSGALVAWRPPTGVSPVTFRLPLYGEERFRFAPRASSGPAALERFEIRPEAACLPAFGMVRRGRALLGVVVAGAEHTRVQGALAGHLVDLNRIGAEFVYRRPYTAFLSRTVTIQRYQRDREGGDRAVRFVFLGPGDWQTMAAGYRRVAGLASTPGGTAAAAATSSAGPAAAAPPSLVVRVFCGIRTRRVFGDRLVATTTFAQAAGIARAVRAAGVGRFALVLVGWESGGYAGRLPRMRPPEAELGGERGLRELAAACRALGVRLFLEADWTIAVKGGAGFRAGRDALRDLNDHPVTDGQGAFLVSPRAAVERFAGPDLAAFARWGVDGVAVRNLGTVLMGDYREGRSLGRSGSLGCLLQLVSMARASGLAVLADGGNAYTAPLVEGLYNVPGASSRYLFVDRDVPLLQMALGGGRWLAGRPLNLAPDLRDAILATVAAGMVPTLELTAEDPVSLRGTAYDQLVRSRADEMLAEAGELLARVDRETAGTAGRPLVGIGPAAEGVTVLAFEGGGELVVNRSSRPFVWKGRTVAAGDLAGFVGGGSR